METPAVTLELQRKLREQTKLDAPPDHLVRRFPAYPRVIRKLEHDPAMAVVEFQCDPPAEAVRDLALGEVVQAQLKWFPPLYTLPLFAFGMFPLVVGSVGLYVTKLRQRRNPAPRRLSYEPAAANAALLAADADQAPIRFLGEQLVAMIEDHALDPSLLATCEWTLDRHGQRAAELLRQGMGQSGSVREELDHLKNLVSGNRSPYSHDALQNGRLHERLLSLLEVIEPETLERETSPRLRRLAR
jgi:hypothetical protein